MQNRRSSSTPLQLSQEAQNAVQDCHWMRRTPRHIQIHRHGRAGGRDEPRNRAEDNTKKSRTGGHPGIVFQKQRNRSANEKENQRCYEKFYFSDELFVTLERLQVCPATLQVV